MTTGPQYEHTQKGWTYVALYTGALAALAGAWFSRDDRPAMIIVCVAACCMGLLALCFQTLTVRDEGEHLGVRFGPLAVFRTDVPYAEITAVETARSSIIDGWGIHWMPGRGWTYNLWGFDCVRITLGRKTIRIGTDDPEGLAGFLKIKIAPDGSSPWLLAGD
ncbi:MAG: hypothetical protein ISS78_05985 [Phycisphaerae bacterium]|nr:hypothetical protein [Phycisphaerae bacterium]